MDSGGECGHSVGMRAEENINDGVAGERAVIHSKNQRRWSEEERRQIVGETLAPGASVARVARAHGVNANMVFTWRKQYRSSQPNAAVLLPVKITQPGEPVRTATAGPSAVDRKSRSGIIHVTIGKAQVRIEGDVDRETLRLVLKSVLR